MALQARFPVRRTGMFYGLGAGQAQFIDWAIAGKLGLFFGFSPVRFGETSIGGLMSLDDNKVRPLFRQHAGSSQKVNLTKTQPGTATDWQRIAECPHSVRLTVRDIVISADEIARIEAPAMSRRLPTRFGRLVKTKDVNWLP